MNIVLTGLRGTGKTTLGKIIANKLNFDFIDLDPEIEKKEGQSIAEIVKAKGWEHFRQLEKSIASELSTSDKHVISTGGGTMIDKECAEKLKKNGFVILLTADIKELEKRIHGDDNRPSLTGQSSHSELEEIWEQRKTQYHSVADLTYDTTENVDWETKAEEIIKSIPYRPIN